MPDLSLRGVARDGNRLVATFKNMYTETREELRSDHVVVEHGTLPADGLADQGLKAASRNHGEIDLEGHWPGVPRLVAAQPGRLVSGVPRRRRGGPAATSTRRSSTACGCARTSDAGVCRSGWARRSETQELRDLGNDLRVHLGTVGPFRVVANWVVVFGDPAPALPPGLHIPKKVK